MINVKLTWKVEQLPLDQHRLAYIHGRLEGNALAQVKPYITATGITLTNVAALLEIFQTAFGDPDPQGTANRELRKLRQLNNEFSTYVAEFIRLSANVPWDERARLDHLQAGLSHELQQVLVFLDNAITVNELINHVRRLKTRQRALQAISRTTQLWRTMTPQTPRQTTTCNGDGDVTMTALWGAQR